MLYLDEKIVMNPIERLSGMCGCSEKFDTTTVLHCVIILGLEIRVP